MSAASQIRIGANTSLEISALSEGTSDQLYLALRLAALQVQRKPDRMMPLVLDDGFFGNFTVNFPRVHPKSNLPQ